MTTTTLGLKLDLRTTQRLKAAAEKLDRSPHWLMKHAAIDWISRVEGGACVNDLIGFEAVEMDSTRHSIRLRNEL